MAETVLGMFRHGQTEWNINLRLQGTADTQLNQSGIDQVEMATAVIGEWDLLLTSPLSRARQSAEIISKAIGLEPVVSERLLERSFGIGEGMTYEQWHQRYSKLDQIPGAESEFSVFRRSQKLLDEIQTEHSGKRVLVVTHGALIRFVLNLVTDNEFPPKGERLMNASLHTFRFSESWKLDRWSPESIGLDQ
ncbi:MAG: histidine phosphatase family protein [Microbacteriaceae bacterium]|jgi:broad specificity phosphatase PhoE|nr:histidine phosphatase family protein [Microbacteriaceae bacterium]MDR9443412.1 histidine phosphatase family protein [Microbacteriaceae bacterium]